MFKKFARNFVFFASAASVSFGAYRLTVNETAILPPMKHARTIPFRKAEPRIDKVACVADLMGMIQQTAKEVGLDPKLLVAVMDIESGCNHKALSSRGAVGLMQVMPATGKLVGVNDLHLPANNIRAGARYLASMKDTFGSNMSLALAAYNAGPSAVRKHGGVPPFPETQRYVRDVMKRYAELSKSSAV